MIGRDAQDDVSRVTYWISSTFQELRVVTLLRPQLGC